MDLMELSIKQNILEETKQEWLRIVDKHDSGEEITEEDIQYLLIAGAGMIGIIQEELLTPALEKYTGKGPLN